MARLQTMVQLSEELVHVLDAEAARRGMSRSALIREILSTSLHESAEAEVARRIVEGYRRIPPATPDAWGELDRQADAATREVLERLDAEEAARGATW